MKFYLLAFLATIISINISAQSTKKITCQLLSAENGMPVEGATIISTKGSPISIFSDTNGLFELQLVSGTVLSISHASFQTMKVLTDSLKNAPNILYMQPNNKVLENVVINTGYEEIALHKATGSYVQIDNTLFNRSASTSVLDRLDGITSSLYFDKRKDVDAPMQIRGISTLGYASTKPLIILDNFPYEGDIENINPNDVENVTILRDAAATSIWGARAGNGIIVINTKKGLKNKPLRISVNMNTIVQPRPDLFSVDRISTSDYIDVEKFLFEKGFYDSKLNNSKDYSPLTPVIYLLADQRAGKISEKEATDQINSLRNKDVRNDFLKYIYQPSVTKTVGVSLSGGDRQSSYYFSANGDESSASLKGNKNTRVNIVSKVSFQPLKKLQLEGGVSYVRRQATLINRLGYGNLVAKSNTDLYPYAQLADESGNPTVIEKDYKIFFLDTLGGGSLLDWKYKPLEELNYENNVTTSNSIIINTGVHYKLTPFLNLEARYQFQQDQSNNNDVYDVKSYNARSWINQFTTITSKGVEYGVPLGGITYNRNSQTITQNIRGQINFNKNFNHDLNMTMVAGGEVRSSDFSSQEFQLYGVDKNLNWTNINPINVTPSLYNIFGSGYIPSGISVKETSLRFISAYSSASFSFKKLYILSSSIRYDASNLFGVKTNQKGVPLWSVGLATNISDQKNYFLKWLPYLKFRSTIGFSGNLSPVSSALTTITHRSASSQAITQLPFAAIANYTNPDLRWEKVRVINFGLDFQLSKNKLGGSLDYYLKRSTDLLGPEILNPTRGIPTLYTNSGQLNGSGFDLAIYSKNISTQILGWNTNLNFSFNNSIVKKYLGTNFTNGLTNDGLRFLRIEGYNPFSIVSYPWAGLSSEGDPQGFINRNISMNYDSLKSLALEDQIISGSAIPHFFGSLRNDFQYKSIQLSFNLLFKFDYYLRKPALYYNDLFKSGKSISEFQDRWQQSGDENKTSVPAMIYPVNSSRDQFYQYSDINVLRGDHVRINDIRLSYRFNKIASTIKIISGEIFVIASNLNVLLWKANNAGIDPEFPSGLKSMRTYTLGLKIDF